MYEETVDNVYRGKLIGLEVHDKFCDFVKLVASKVDQLKQQEADLGDIPDEFMGMIFILIPLFFSKHLIHGVNLLLLVVLNKP
jgi:hypothetical protein